jgi:hypothetical protein
MPFGNLESLRKKFAFISARTSYYGNPTSFPIVFSPVSGGSHMGIYVYVFKSQCSLTNGYLVSHQTFIDDEVRPPAAAKQTPIGIALEATLCTVAGLFGMLSCRYMHARPPCCYTF